METEAKKQQRTHRQLKQRRNVCLALAQRETHGSVAHRIQQLTLPRTQWSLASVLHRDEGLVLLGFSSDGHFLCACLLLAAVLRLSLYGRHS